MKLEIKIILINSLGKKCSKQIFSSQQSKSAENVKCKQRNYYKIFVSKESTCRQVNC